jgi:hypothetical protein
MRRAGKQATYQERQLAEQAELAYLRLIGDWKAAASAADKGAGAAPGGVSHGPSSDQAARQNTSPQNPRFSPQ